MARKRANTTDDGLPVLPLELRDQPADPAELPEWRAARRRWEAESGMTVAELRRRQLERARAGGLRAINALFEPPEFIETDEDEPADPRTRQEGNQL